MRTHTVQPGERLSAIAQHYGIGVGAILDANPAKARARTPRGAEVFASLAFGEPITIPVNVESPVSCIDPNAHIDRFGNCACNPGHFVAPTGHCMRPVEFLPPPPHTFTALGALAQTPAYAACPNGFAYHDDGICRAPDGTSAIPSCDFPSPFWDAGVKACGKASAWLQPGAVCQTGSTYMSDGFCYDEQAVRTEPACLVAPNTTWSATARACVSSVWDLAPTSLPQGKACAEGRVFLSDGLCHALVSSTTMGAHRLGDQLYEIPNTAIIPSETDGLDTPVVIVPVTPVNPPGAPPGPVVTPPFQPPFVEPTKPWVWVLGAAGMFALGAGVMHFSMKGNHGK